MTMEQIQLARDGTAAVLCWATSQPVVCGCTESGHSLTTVLGRHWRVNRQLWPQRYPLGTLHAPLRSIHWGPLGPVGLLPIFQRQTIEKGRPAWPVGKWLIFRLGLTSCKQEPSNSLPESPPAVPAAAGDGNMWRGVRNHRQLSHCEFPGRALA